MTVPSASTTGKALTRCRRSRPAISRNEASFVTATTWVVITSLTVALMPPAHREATGLAQRPRSRHGMTCATCRKVNTTVRSDPHETERTRRAAHTQAARRRRSKLPRLFRAEGLDLGLFGLGEFARHFPAGVLGVLHLVPDL